MEIKGIVETRKEGTAKTKRGNVPTTNLKINGDWYNCFKDYGAQEGDTVIVDYEMNGQYTNVQKITVLAGESAPKPNVFDSAPKNNTNVQKSIVRQNALSHATSVVLNKDIVKDYNNDDIANEIIRVAQKFENYVNS